MKIVCIGGGPAGLYFGLLMKMRNPTHDITVVERNKPYDTFGWGVVFSDATMDNMREWDPVTAAEIEQAFNHWDDIELEFKGEVIRSGGHGFVGIGRKKLLNILQRRCEQLEVKLVFDTDVQSDEDFPDADLIIACDGINSRIRDKYAAIFKPDIVVRPNRYIWLGTNKLYDAFTFLFEKTEHGWFQAHIYKFDENTTTFIVECPEHVWQAHRLDLADQAESIAFCEKVFAKNLQGARLMTNARHLRGSAWLNFQRVKCEQWSLFNGKSHVVLMGDAVHTAHFAIGSGTKLAIEDAIELTRLFVEMGDTAEHIPEVLARYQEVRGVEVLKLQNAAWNAMAWFEVCGERYCDRFEPQQFMYSMLTRSQRISHENLRLRDAKWLEGYEAWFSGGTVMPPMLTPFKLRSITLKNRIVVSPMAQYSAVDGVVQDHHLVHLGARALGGAAMVMVEMTSPTPEGRISPACPGLWNDAQTAALKRIVDFVHAPGRRPDRPAVRPQWPQGLDPRRLGRQRRTAAGRQLAADGRQRRGLRRAEPDAARHDPRRHGHADRAVRRLHTPRRGRRLRLAGTALRPRLPVVKLHLPFDQPAHRRLRWHARKPLPLPAGGFRRHARSLAGGPTDERAHLGARLGAGWQHRRRRGADGPAVQGGGLRPDRRLIRANHARGQTRVRPHVPDAVCRPHPQRGRHCHDGGRRDQ